MSTTRRSEGVNAFFDGFVHSKTSLKQFVEQYSNALASKVEKERQADSDSSNKLVPCVTKFEIEKQAQQVYTIIKFQEFQKELTGKMYCDFLSCKDEGGISITDIQEDVEVGEGLKRVTFNVPFNKWKCEVKCSCRNFEFRGILCRHALTVLLRNNVVKIPEKYILRIWRKDVKRCHTRVNICYYARDTTLEQSRFDKINRAFTKLADIAVDDDDDSNYVLNLLCNAMSDLLKKKTKLPTVIIDDSTLDGPNILNPTLVRKKGRPPSKRKESSIWKNQRAKKKQRSPQRVKNATCISKALEKNVDVNPIQGITTSKVIPRSEPACSNNSVQIDSTFHLMKVNDNYPPLLSKQPLSFTPNVMPSNPHLFMNMNVPWNWNHATPNQLLCESSDTVGFQAMNASEELFCNPPFMNCFSRSRE